MSFFTNENGGGDVGDEREEIMKELRELLFECGITLECVVKTESIRNRMEDILKILFKSRKEMEKKEEILKIAQEGRENLSNIQETMKELMEYKDMDQIHEILKECGLALMAVCRFEPIKTRMDELLKILLKNRRKEAQIERILKNVEEGKENLTHIQNLMRELVENWNGDETTTAKKWVLFNFNFFFMRKDKIFNF